MCAHLRRCLALLLWWSVALGGAAQPTLYELLGVASTATVKQVRKAWHAKALTHHPDKAGGAADVEEKTRIFKQLADAYEILSDKELRAEYDRTGAVPDGKKRAEAADRSRKDENAEEFGFEGGQGNHHRSFGWERFSAFEIKMAQQRARRVRSLEGMRKLLQDAHGEPQRCGLVGFYRRGDEAALKDALRFPYPFAGWSMPTEGRGFWWEHTLQTFLVALSPSTEASEISAHFGLSHSSELPALAWVNKDKALSFEIARPRPVPFATPNEPFVTWIYGKLGCSLRLVNRDHRPAKIWWLDGNYAKEMAVVQPGQTYAHGSFVSHR